MYCSTCGAHLPPGRAHCATCGAPAPVPAAYGPAAYSGGAPAPPAPVYPAHFHPQPAHVPHGHAHAASARVCTRCGYAGEGISYFNKGSNIAGLVVLGLISAGFMGLFALIYYFSFHEHRVCPRCGKDWGKFGARGNPALAGAPGAAATLPALPGTGSASQGWAVVLFILAALLVVGGIGGGAAPPVVMGAGAAAGGWFLQQSARKKREARKQAILTSLQLPVLQLAAERQGRLTVTEVAAALGWPLPRAEKVLQSLDDGLRVSSDVMDGGVIVYEFRELEHARRLPGTFA